MTPVGGDDTATTPAETLVVIDIADNDICVDCDYATATTTDPANGTVVVNLDGTLTYTPDDDFSGIETFTYTVTDPVTLVELTHTVTVTVTPVGDDDTATTPAETLVVIDIADNDICVDCDYATATTTDPANGTVVVNPDGTVTYTPDDDFSGIDTFTYTVTDPVTLVELTHTVTVTVTPVGDDDTATTPAETLVVIDIADNDICVDCDYATATTTEPGHGTVVVNPDGTVTYTPDDGWSGVDTFTYTVTDPVTGTDVTQTVTVTVTPVGGDDTATTPVETPVVIDVADNDTCVDCDYLTVTTTEPGHGTVVVNVDGTLTYTPADGWSGIDTFTYTVTDPVTGTDVTQTVTVTVTPVGGDDTATTPVETPVVIDVADNDTCVDCDYATATTTDPANGTVVVNLDGTLTYTPADGWSGIDTFTYTVTDPVTGTDVTQTVTVTVTPVGGDDTATTPVETPVVIDVADNDTCVDCDYLTVTTTEPGHGTVVVNVDGTLTYTPADGWSGIDTFTYTVTDPVTGTDVTQTVTVTVTPVGGDDTATTPVETPVVIDVADNDTCVDCDYLTVTTTEPGHGTVVVNVDGTVTYTPEDGWSGVDSFTYSVFDSVTSTTVTQTVTVTVTPVGGDDVVSTAVATPVDVDIAGNDTCVGCVYGSASVSVR